MVAGGCWGDFPSRKKWQWSSIRAASSALADAPHSLSHRRTWRHISTAARERTDRRTDGREREYESP